MKKILAFFCIASLVLACGDGQESAANLEKGKEVYQGYCVACHGKDGEMSLNGAKKFSESIMTLEERIAIITNGKNFMTPYKGVIPDEDIRAAAAYTMELTKAGKK